MGCFADVVQKQVSLVLQAIQIARGLQAGQLEADALEVPEAGSKGPEEVIEAPGKNGTAVRPLLSDGDQFFQYVMRN